MRSSLFAVFQVHHLKVKCATVAPKRCAYSKTAGSKIWMCPHCQPEPKIYIHTELHLLHSQATVGLFHFLIVGLLG